MTFRTLDDAGSLAGKTALVRVDFNVPMEDGRITDDTRLRVALPTINKLREAGAKVALLAHFDRPKGQVVPSMSLKPLVGPLAEILGAPVHFAEDCVGGPAHAAINGLDAGGVVLLGVLLVVGAGYSTVQPGGSKSVASWFDGSRRGTAMGIRQAGLPLGAALASATLPLIGAAFG